MLLQRLRALCLAPGGPGSIWNYLAAPVRSTEVSGRFACGFLTYLNFADVDSKGNQHANEINQWQAKEAMWDHGVLLETLMGVLTVVCHMSPSCYALLEKVTSWYYQPLRYAMVNI